MSNDTPYTDEELAAVRARAARETYRTEDVPRLLATLDLARTEAKADTRERDDARLDYEAARDERDEAREALESHRLRLVALLSSPDCPTPPDMGMDVLVEAAGNSIARAAKMREMAADMLAERDGYRKKLDEERDAWKGMQPVPQRFVAEMIERLTAAGMGKPGTPNCLVDMVNEVCAALDEERRNADALLVGLRELGGTVALWLVHLAGCGTCRMTSTGGNAMNVTACATGAKVLGEYNAARALVSSLRAIHARRSVPATVPVVQGETREQAVEACVTAADRACGVSGLDGGDPMEAENVLAGTPNVSTRKWAVAFLDAAKHHPILADSPVLAPQVVTPAAPNTPTGTMLSAWTGIAGDWYRHAPADNEDGRRIVAHAFAEDAFQASFGWRVFNFGRLVDGADGLPTLQAAMDAADKCIREHTAALGVGLPGEGE